MAARPEVRVGQPVMERLRVLPRDQASAVAKAILAIGDARGDLLDLEVPGDPPETVYLALEPGHWAAPVVVYRRTIPGEQGDWVAVALYDRAGYRARREMERRGEDMTLMRAVAAVIAAGYLVSAHPGRHI